MLSIRENEANRAKPCLALIGDMVRSRELSRGQRPKIQERFKEFTQYLNKRYAKDILSRFVITLGDEFQGLLLSATPIPDLMWDIEHRFSDRDLRVGVGFGVLNTPIQKEAINVDGPALYNARTAIESSRSKRSLGGVFVGFGEMDQVLNGIARILSFHRSKFTQQQLRIAELMREGLTHMEAADQLKISRQAVSKQVKSMGWGAYSEAEAAWRVFIEKWVNPKIEKKRAKDHN
jgi:SatD family (SatD)